MTTNLASLAGVVILAGGASRRMGTPKAELRLPTGERLLDYHVRQAIKLNVPIMIADNGRDFSVDSELLATNPQLSIAHITDYDSPSVVENDETEGPLVAIESALQSLTSQSSNDQLADESSSWLMVISCDSLVTAHNLWQQLNPYIATTADSMANVQNSVEATIPVTDKAIICLNDDDHLYPLLGLYRLSVEPEMRAYIDSGERKVMSFIKPRAHAVAISKQAKPLTNFNTPEDFKRACESLYDV